MKLLILFLFITGCQYKAGPEKILEDFINYRLSGNQEKDFYLESTTGKMKDFIGSMGPEEFQNFTKADRFSNSKIKIDFKKCSEKQCSITYTIKYDYSSEEEGTKGFESEIKKVAQLENEEGQWKISDLMNVKTFIKSNEPINP